MGYTQQQFDSLSISDLEKQKFTLTAQGEVAVRVRNVGSDGVPIGYDASGGTLPMVISGIPAWFVITVAGTLPTVGAVTVGQLLMYNGSSWYIITINNSVTSVFGRTGSITAQSGDYTTDQITETISRVFLTPSLLTKISRYATTTLDGLLSASDWNIFNNKQDALVSGTNIKTINGNNILGSGNIEISGSGTGDVTTSGTLTADTIILGNGRKSVKSSSKSIVIILGSDDTTVPTSKAVKDQLDTKQGSLSGTGFVKSVAGVISYDTNTYVPETRTVNGKALSANITLGTADIADSTDKRYVTDAQKTVIGNTSGTNTGDETNATILAKLGYTPENISNKENTTIDNSTTKYPTVKLLNDALTTAKSYADSLVVGLLNDRGNYNASVNTFPASGGSGSGGTILKGDLWTASVAGTLGGVAVSIGDTIRALTNAPGQTASNWAITEANIGYTPENNSNKATTMSGNTTSNIVYLTAKAVYDWATSLFAQLSGATFTGSISATNLSGTNTGDNAVNSLYSGLATSKQDTLVSGTNIKTVNSQSLLGSGDITISAGGTYWTAVPGSPTRTGNTTFTLTDTSNANLYDLLISRGTVVKWTESSTVKQAMVVSATYATNTVTVTLVGDTMASIDSNSLKYGAVKAREVTFAYLPTVGTGTDIMGRWFAGEKTKVHGAIAYHGTAGTTNATTYDINKNGTTIFTTKLSVASGATVGSDTTADSTSYLDTNDYLTVDCDSVSTTAPVYATIKVFVSPYNDIYLA